METFSALLALCAGNSSVPVNSPHKGQWRGALMFSLICTRINGWVNNGEAGDLRRNRADYDVTVMRPRKACMCEHDLGVICFEILVIGLAMLHEIYVYTLQSYNMSDVYNWYLDLICIYNESIYQLWNHLQYLKKTKNKCWHLSWPSNMVYIQMYPTINNSTWIHIPDIVMSLTVK